MNAITPKILQNDDTLKLPTTCFAASPWEAFQKVHTKEEGLGRENIETQR
jgi:hypothetical protein